MKIYLSAALMVVLLSGMVLMPSYADTTHAKTRVDLTKNLRVPQSSATPYGYDHQTNVHFGNTVKTNSVGKNNQDLKAQGNFVAGQPWGGSTVTANQATQAHQTQNSQQAQNAHQAGQAQQAHENQPSHKSNPLSLQQFGKNNKPAPKLP